MNNPSQTLNLTEENFHSVVVEGSRERPVLVDFWASWCQPCRILMPLLDRLAEEYAGRFVLAKLNTEEQQGLAARFGIRSIPTVKLFRDGEPVDEFMGALPESEIRLFLERHLPRESDRLAERAMGALRGGDVEGAREGMREAQAMDPDNPRVRLAAIRLHAALEELDEAEQALDALPINMQTEPEVKALRARLLFDREAAAAPPLAQLEAALAAGDAGGETLFPLAARRVVDDRMEEALELLIELMKRDRDYGDQAARRGLLAVFELLGGSGDLVNRYRARMSNLLY